MIGCPARVELRKYLTRDGSLGPERYDWVEAHVEECLLCQAHARRSDDRGRARRNDDARPGRPRIPHLQVPRVRSVRRGLAGTGPEPAASRRGEDAQGGRRPPPSADERLQALRRDAHLLTQVGHPNVVQVYAWVTVGEQHFLIMQYVAGGSLADRLKAEGPLDWQRAARYVADVGEGLLEVHEQGIVHRDVKPANILWDPKRDEAVLTDFGVGSWLADPASVAGSLPYMAPEAYDGQVSPALDVYSLASTLFHLVTGSQPFRRHTDLRL